MIAPQKRRLQLEKLEDRTMLSGLPQQVVVMSENLYMGADPIPVIASALTGVPALAIPSVTQFWSEVQKTNFDERADAIAGQIVTNQPDLIGLQEVMKYFSGPADSLLGNPSKAGTVELDFLQVLLNKISAKGGNYKTVSVVPLSEFELPGLIHGQLKDLRLVDHMAILARNDLPVTKVQFQNPLGGPFAVNLTLPRAIGNPLVIHRGWNSVDVTWGNNDFRFINMCLETPVAPVIQAVQGVELLLGPVSTNRPVILVGDSNSNGSTPGAPNSFTYNIMVGAGMTDAWAQTNKGDPGYTWGNAPDLKNTQSMSYHPFYQDPFRMDLVLYHGSFQAVAMQRLGVDPLTERTKSGLWPSDHAGVVAKLDITGPLNTGSTSPASVGNAWAAFNFIIEETSANAGYRSDAVAWAGLEELGASVAHVRYGEQAVAGFVIGSDDVALQDSFVTPGELSRGIGILHEMSVNDTSSGETPGTVELDLIELMLIDAVFAAESLLNEEIQRDLLRR